MGKASVSNIVVSLGFVVVPKALAMARLSAAARLFTILPLSSSQFCLLAPYCYHPLPGWHPTALHRLAPYCYSPAGTLLLIVVGWHPLCSVAPLAPLPLRSFGLSSVTPSRGIALPLWLCPTPWINVMSCLNVHHGCGGPSTGVFLCHRSSILSIRPRKGLSGAVVSFVLGSLRKGLGLSTCTFLCIVSLRVWGILS